MSCNLFVIHMALQDQSISPLILTAARFGELDTLTDLINEKGTDPCLTDDVSQLNVNG